MHRGYIKLWRALYDSDMWKCEKFTRGQAWVDLLLLANHADGFIRVSGQRIAINRGELGWSELNLAKRWKWSRGKVRRFLAELESEMEQKIVQRKSNVTTIIKILNYEKYQGNGTTDDTPDGHPIVHQTDTRWDTNKNDKNVKNNNIAETGIPFQVILDLYHEILSDLPAVRVLTTKRKAAIKARWLSRFELSDGTRSDSMTFWQRYFEYVRESKFLMGQTQPTNGHKQFVADLEWLTNESNFAKVIEGKYHN